MSLTKLTQSKSAKKYLASNGVIYLLQKADTTSMIIEHGGLADLLSARNADGSIEDFLKTNPVLAESAIRTQLNLIPKTLKSGLIGEILEDGSMMLYRWSDKPAVLLEEGELNAALIPVDLRDELLEQIKKLSEPQVKSEDVTRFPEQ
jgi:hypothetical protein